MRGLNFKHLFIHVLFGTIEHFDDLVEGEFGIDEHEVVHPAFLPVASDDRAPVLDELFPLHTEQMVQIRTSLATIPAPLQVVAHRLVEDLAREMGREDVDLGRERKVGLGGSGFLKHLGQF